MVSLVLCTHVAGRLGRTRALLGGRPALGEAEAAGFHRVGRCTCGGASFRREICRGKVRGRGRRCGWVCPLPSSCNLPRVGRLEPPRAGFRAGGVCSPVCPGGPQRGGGRASPEHPATAELPAGDRTQGPLLALVFKHDFAREVFAKCCPSRQRWPQGQGGVPGSQLCMHSPWDHLV